MYMLTDYSAYFGCFRRNLGTKMGQASVRPVRQNIFQGKASQVPLLVALSLLRDHIFLWHLGSDAFYSNRCSVHAHRIE